MLKKRSSVCMKQVLIPPYCRMCVAAAREESLMCFPSPPSPTASKPWLLLRHKNYIVVSSATKAGLPCELSPSLSPFASCAFSVLAFVFRFFLSILWDFFVPSPCKQCRDDAGYPRFSAELRWASVGVVTYIFVCTASFLWIWLSPLSSAATADGSATLGTERLAVGFIYLLISYWFMFMFFLLFFRLFFFFFFSSSSLNCACMP